MIDLHNHIVPGVDDGVKSLEEAEFIISSLIKMGFKKLILTPHWNHLNRELYFQGIVTRQFKLIKSINSNVELELGAEVRFDDVAMETFLQNKIPTYPGGKAILIEFRPTPFAPVNIKHILFKIKTKGVLPILAHPERFPFLRSDPNLVSTLFEMEIGFLMDLPSITGKLGRDIKNTAIRWLKEGYYHAAATDIHNKEEIKFVEAGLEILEKLLKADFSKFMDKNPALLLEGILPQ